nr:unnamed protein product [Spirometra erinaceieuropaei]
MRLVTTKADPPSPHPAKRRSRTPSPPVPPRRPDFIFAEAAAPVGVEEAEEEEVVKEKEEEEEVIVREEAEAEVKSAVPVEEEAVVPGEEEAVAEAAAPVGVEEAEEEEVVKEKEEEEEVIVREEAEAEVKSAVPVEEEAVVPGEEEAVAEAAAPVGVEEAEEEEVVKEKEEEEEVIVREEAEAEVKSAVPVEEEAVVPGEEEAVAEAAAPVGVEEAEEEEVVKEKEEEEEVIVREEAEAEVKSAVPVEEEAVVPGEEEAVAEAAAPVGVEEAEEEEVVKEKEEEEEVIVREEAEAEVKSAVPVEEEAVVPGEEEAVAEAAAPVGVEEAEEEEVVKEKEEEEEVIVREEAEAEVKSAVPVEEQAVVPIFEEGVSVFSSVDLGDLRSSLLPVTSSSFVESSVVSEFVPELSESYPLPVLSSVDSRHSESGLSPSCSVCLFDSARSSESVRFPREMLMSSDFGEFDSASLCCLPDGGSPLVLGLNVSDFRFDSVSPLASESDLCVPLSEASHLQTYPSPQILPLDGCHLPVCRPIEMDVFETLPTSDITALHLGLTHTFGAFTERVSFIDSLPPGASGSSSASAPPPPMSDKRGVHIALADVVKFSHEEVKAMLDFPDGVTATTSLSEPPPYAVPSEEVDEAAIHIDTLGSALPVPFARSPQPESVRSLRPDPNLHSATCLALTESVDQEILMPLDLPTGLPCVVSAADCLVPARPRPESYPLTTRRRRTSDTDFRSKLSIASVQTVSSHLHRPLFTACVEELLWAGEDEVVFLADSLTEVHHCIPVVTDVCLLYPRATPCLKPIQQLSVHDPLRPLKHLPSDLMEAELDLTPDFAALPFPLTEKAPTTQTEESIKDVEEEYYSMKVASGLLRTSVPEMRTNSLLGEKSEAVLSLLPTAPVSSAPVSREFVSNEVPPPVCFSSPTLETEQEQQKQQQGEQQGSVTSSETVSNSPSDLDVWVLSKSSSSVEAGSGDEKTAEEATEEGETAAGVGITQPAYSHADGDVTPQQHSCTPLLLSQDEDTFAETLPTATNLSLPVVEDDLSQLAAAAGAALAAEFAQTPDEDEEEEVEGNGCDQEDKESDRLRGLPLTLPTSRSVSKQQGYKTSLATLDRSSRILSRLKFYGIGATPSSSARHEETEETGSEEWENETGTGGAEETAKELPFATSSEERRLKEEQFLDPNQSVHELMIEEVEMDVEPLSPIQEVGVHEQISSPEDSLDEDDTKLTLPEDFELVPAQEDPDSLSSSSSASLPPTSRLLTRPHSKRFSTSSQRSSEFAAGSVCSDTADESSRDSQSTVVFMGRPDIPPPTSVMPSAHPGESEPGEFVESSQSPQQDGSRTTLASVESDLNLISESGREAHSRLPNAASLPRLQQPSPSTPVDTNKLLASQPIASRETKASPVPTSHHLSGLASTPSLLGRSTSSNVYFPQKSRLAKMKVLTTGPGVSAPALTQASDTESRSSSLSEFERLERQMCATSSPEALQRKQSPSSVLHESSSSKTPSSLSEFERLETAMEAGTSSSLSSSGDVQGRNVDVSGGGEGSSQLSLVEFLRVETECQKEDVDDTHPQATSTTTVPSSVTEGVFAPLPYTKIDTIYEDMLAEQACQSLESSRQTDSDLSSSVAAQASSMLTTAAAEAIEGSACESDSLTQSSLCDSLIPTCSLVESSSLSFREHQPSVNIQYIIREARDVIERGFFRERDSLGEEDSLSSSSDVEGLPARSSSLELDPHPEPSGQSLLPSGLLQTSQDSLDDILPIQGGEDVSISSSSFSQALHSCPMTDSLEDSGAAMASCSRTSTQSPSRTELSKQAGVFDTNLPFALEAQGEPEDYVQEGGEKETKMRQMGSLELRATSDDEALAKRSRTHEGRIPSRLGPSMSSGSLHDASVLGLEAAPVSRTDSNLGSTIFDISEEELGVGGGKSILQPPASLTCSPLRSMTSSQTSEILEVGETVETGTLVETTGFPPVSQLTDLLAQATPQAPQTLAEQKFQPFVFEETEDDFTVITRLADVQTTGSTESHVVPERKTEERQDEICRLIRISIHLAVITRMLSTFAHNLCRSGP